VDGSGIGFSSALDAVPDQLAVGDGCRFTAGTWQESGAIRLWDAKGGFVGQGLNSGAAVAAELTFSPNGRRLLSEFTSGAATTLRLWNTFDGKLIRQIDEGLATDFVFTQDSRMFYGTSYGGLNHLYWSERGEDSGADLEEGFQENSDESQPELDARVTTLATTGGGGVFRINLADPKRKEKVLSEDASSLAVSPGGRIVAAIAKGALFLSNEPQKPVGQDLTLVRFSPTDSSRLLTVSRGGAVQLRDSAGGGAVGSPVLLRAGYGGYVEFSRDGKYVLARTAQWGHLLRVTDRGLEAFASRELSAVAESVWLLPGAKGAVPRAAVMVTVAGARRVEVLDFENRVAGKRSPAAAYSDKEQQEWERRVGLHLEQGEIVPLNAP
jgi:WD40 repeat protein